MPHPRSLLLSTLALTACGRSTPATGKDAAAAPAPAIDAAPVVDARPIPTAIDLTGLYDGDACLIVRFPDSTLVASDATRCGERLRPASTFKIVNALIGADAGLLDGPDAIMIYDGKKYPKQDHWPDAWAHDQPLRAAMEVSAVPLFRRLATQIGADRMQAAIDVLHYGNRDLGGGLDSFWLNGKLAVSAREQVELLTSLVTRKLPVSPRAMEIVREVIPREVAPDGAVIHFKTGTAPLDGGPWIGWLVGWIDPAGGVAPRPTGEAGATIEYACWIKHPPADVEVIRAKRIEVCRGALARLGLFPMPVPTPAP